MPRAREPLRGVDQRHRELREMSGECIAEGIPRSLELGELEAIEPQPTAILAAVGVDAAYPHAAEQRTGPRTLQFVSHGAPSIRN
jgi:hypothetical protein